MNPRSSLVFRGAPCFFLFFLGLAGCSSDSLKTDPVYADKKQAEQYKYGSLLSDSGGFSFLGDAEKKAENAGPGVNAFLWRASMDTVAFLPIMTADPFGGMIATDWQTSEGAPNERLKLNVLVLDRELRADGVKVTVFRQIKKDGEGWVDAPASPETALALEKTILTRARQLWLAQKEKK